MVSEKFNLEGKLAVVTGGGTGIGLGIAQSFVDAGARVVIVGRKEAVLQKACMQLGEKSSYRICDLSILSTIPGLITDTEADCGPIDILVNNAGIHLKSWAQDTNDDDFAKIIQTNLLSVFSITREAAKGMVKRGNGSIIFISSMAGLFGIDRVSAYGASKAALIGLMNNLMTEYSPHNVRVNCIAPGWIASDMFFKAIESDPERKAKITNRIALPRFGKPEDIGNSAIFLCSEAGSYITGCVLPVDGGASVNF